MDLNEDVKYKDKITIKDLALLKRFAKYLKPYLPKFILFLVLDIVATFIVMGEPLIWGYYIDDLNRLFGLSNQNVMTLLFYGVSYLIMFGTFVILMYFCNLGFQKIGQNVIYDIRTEVFYHIEHLSIAQINSMPIGKFVTRVTNDTQSLSMFFTDILVSLFRNVFSIAAVLIYAFILEWKLAFVILGFIPVVFIITYFVRKKAKRNYRTVRNTISEINAFLSENLSGMKTIQIFNQEMRKGKEFDKINDKLKDDWTRVMRLWAFYHPAMYAIHMICVAIVFAIGIPIIVNQDPNFIILEVGTLFSMYLYTDQFFGPVQQLANLSNMLSNVLSSTEKVCSVLDIHRNVEDDENAVSVDKFIGKIEFKNVWFKYVDDEWVLKDVSFTIEPGQTCAFVGATGAGKSTIINLIVRNYNIQKGQILIDGKDINKIKISSLRRGIGQMLQDVFLFNSTIADNITLNDSSISREEIVKSCEYVGANTFIEKLENKYDEMVRERGNNFSAGQRQLISFARVVCYKPDIVVLDEATSNIDTETEVLIQSSLAKMRNIGTMVIIAHRLSTIKNADNIFVMSKGKIIEQGNHEQLINLGGHYATLYKLQNMQKEMNEI